MNNIMMGINSACRNTKYFHNQHQFPYGITPPRVLIVAPDNDGFLPPSVTE